MHETFYKPTHGLSIAMDNIETAKNLMAGGKYKEAGNVLNRLLQKNRDNDELWYFLGILAVKLKNYESAHEYLERALSIRKKPEYLWFMGMTYMETLELDAAIEAFEDLLRIDSKNVNANFFLSICYLLLDDPTSERYMKKAYTLDKNKTKQLLKNFFHAFASKSPDVKPALKNKIKKELENL